MARLISDDLTARLLYVLKKAYDVARDRAPFSLLHVTLMDELNKLHAEVALAPRTLDSEEVQ